jgi:hypothetical protein
MEDSMMPIMRPGLTPHQLAIDHAKPTLLGSLHDQTPKMLHTLPQVSWCQSHSVQQQEPFIEATLTEPIELSRKYQGLDMGGEFLDLGQSG